MTAAIRRRNDDDVHPCAALLQRVHASDAYPMFWPADPVAWLSPRLLLAAWVIESNGHVVGHVGLSAVASHGASAVWSEATGLSPERLAAITRLFVAPEHRRARLGSALLEAACREATRRGLRAVLDVVATREGATRLYERHGWTRVASQQWPAEPRLEHLFYVAPGLTAIAVAPRGTTRPI